MKKILLSLIVLVISCGVSKSQVNADFDPSTDFSKYKTYYFDGWIQVPQNLTEFDAERLLKALNEEFNKRGILLTDSANASMGMALLLVVDQKSSTTAYTNYNGMGVGYRGVGWGAGVGGPGMGTSTTTYSESDYNQGTLVVDLYEMEGPSLIWQGVMQKTLTENPQKREKKIPQSIAKLMKKYPVKPVKE